MSWRKEKESRPRWQPQMVAVLVGCVFILTSNSAHSRNLRYFKPGKKWREPWGDPPSDDPPQRPKEPELTGRERAIYSVLGVIGCLPILILIVLWILMHSPLIAN